VAVAAGECGRQTLAAVCECADAGEMVQARTPGAPARRPAPHAEPVSFHPALPSSYPTPSPSPSVFSLSPSPSAPAAHASASCADGGRDCAPICIHTRRLTSVTHAARVSVLMQAHTKLAPVNHPAPGHCAPQDHTRLRGRRRHRVQAVPRVLPVRVLAGCFFASAARAAAAMCKLEPQ